MNTSGIDKIINILGNALSVFDFSFFISGAMTLGFLLLDLYYYGHSGFFKVSGWMAVFIYILAIYVCGLMSWSIGKMMRWCILKLIWWKKGGIHGDFIVLFDKTMKNYVVDRKISDDSSRDTLYSEMWVGIEKYPAKASKLNYLNKMWVMVALFEGLSFSWLVGLLVYLDGLIIGKWIVAPCLFYKIVPCMILIGFTVVSLHRATTYSRELVKDVISTYYNK